MSYDSIGLDAIPLALYKMETSFSYKLLKHNNSIMFLNHHLLIYMNSDINRIPLIHLIRELSTWWKQVLVISFSNIIIPIKFPLNHTIYWYIYMNSDINRIPLIHLIREEGRNKIKQIALHGAENWKKNIQQRSNKPIWLNRKHSKLANTTKFHPYLIQLKKC